MPRLASWPSRPRRIGQSPEFGPKHLVWYRAAVSDDDRQRRRLGDATKDRIADLADGWSIPGQPPAIAREDSADPASREADTRPARAITDPAEAIPTSPFAVFDTPEGFEHTQANTVSPPPPEALEVLRGAAARASDDTVSKSLTAMRAKPVRTMPPPPPGAKRPTSPPPIPTTPSQSPAVRGTPPPHPALRLPSSRDDDATTVEPPPMHFNASPAHVAGLRDAPVLRRRPGVLGDLRYPLTVVLGVRSARRELVEVEDEITTLRGARATRLADLGRAAIADDRFDQTAVNTSRDVLSDIEDRRSRHAGAAAAADAELDAIERTREAEVRRLTDAITADEAEVTRLDGELAPLERDAGAARKGTMQVKDTLASIDGRIAAAKASMVSVKGPKNDPASVEADLATLRADREAVARDQSEIAAKLDDLLPRIARLQAARTEATARTAASRAAAIEAKSRATEQVTAVQARRRVENRAASDARTASDKALVELGERLYVERPQDLTIKLGAVETQDVEIATAQRRAIELRELLGSVEKPSMARGVLYWLLLLGAIATAIVLSLTRA